MTHVVVPAQNNQQGRCSRGNENQAILSKRVRIEQAHSGILVSNHVLLILVDTVQDRQIEIRRGIILGHISGVGTEQLMSDQGRICERKGRVASGMAFPLRIIFSAALSL